MTNDDGNIEINIVEYSEHYFLGHVHLFTDDDGSNHFHMGGDLEMHENSEFSGDVVLGVYYWDEWYYSTYWVADLEDSSDEVAGFIDYYGHLDNAAYVHLHFSQWEDSAGNIDNTYMIVENTTEQEFDGEVEIVVGDDSYWAWWWVHSLEEWSSEHSGDNETATTPGTMNID